MLHLSVMYVAPVLSVQHLPICYLLYVQCTDCLFHAVTESPIFYVLLYYFFAATQRKVFCLYQGCNYCVKQGLANTVSGVAAAGSTKKQLIMEGFSDQPLMEK